MSLPRKLVVYPIQDLEDGEWHAAFLTEEGAKMALEQHPLPEDPWWIWQMERHPDAKWAVVEESVS